MKSKLRLTFLNFSFIFDVHLFCFQFYNLPPWSKYCYMLTVSVGLLGIMSSVDCPEDITVEFARVCSFDFSLIWILIRIQNSINLQRGMHVTFCSQIWWGGGRGDCVCLYVWSSVRLNADFTDEFTVPLLFSPQAFQ